MEVFSGSQFRRRSCGEQILLNSELRDVQVIALFFSSRWCCTCRLVSSYLAETYKELKRDKCSFEVVFVSGDHSEEDFKAFVEESHLDWLIVPFKNQTIEQLYSRYGVNQLPALVLINKAGELITPAGIRDLIQVGSASYPLWKEGKASTKDEELTDYHERLCSGCCLLPWGPSTVNREAFLASSSSPCVPPLHLLNGKLLERKSGTVQKTEEALQGVQVVVLCFWASWCSTCVEVLLPLSECYRSWKADNLPVELVFVKLDYCEGPKESFMNEDFPEWLVVPLPEPELGDNSLIRQLFTKFGALRVPLVMVMKPNGEVITVEGLRDMTTKGASAFEDWRQGKGATHASSGPDYLEDKLRDGCCFIPWAAGHYRRTSFSSKIAVCPCEPSSLPPPPPPLPWRQHPPPSLLEDVRVVRNTSHGLEEVSPYEIEKPEVVAFYFAAHWCPPCRTFTPILASMYRKLMIEAVPIEIVFISWDENVDVMKGHMQESHADWLAVAFEDINSRNFTRTFNVDRIPHLCIVSKAGEMITSHGTRDVCLKGTSAVQCWMNGKAATTDEDKFDEIMGPDDES